MAISSVNVISPRLDSYPEEYLPESDGRPMAETDIHRDLMIALLHALKEYFRDHPLVYVSGNIFIYYRDEAGSLQPVSPDIFVVFGVERKDRRIYKLEEEGKAPEVVIELTSTNTKVEDLVAKHYIYARIGVKEYFLFDPYTESIRPALRGFRLEGGEYTPMQGDFLYSEVLGLELRVEHGLLRLYDPKTGERLRTPDEAEIELRLEKATRQAAEDKAEEESAARQAAEARAAEESAARQAAEDKAEEELAARQAAEAKAAAAEAENARLREELATLREEKL
jgi:Uma2 family endonuclease